MKRLAMHHRRRADDVIETHIVSDGVLAFDPPGFTVPLAEIFAEA